MGILLHDHLKPTTVCNSAIICEEGGATSLPGNTFFTHEAKLLLCICNMVYCLNLTTLHLLWRTKVDEATCFEIFPFDGGIITHGELEIAKLDFDGNKKWSFSGSDIFVSPDGAGVFRIANHQITVKDWEGFEYILDAKGRLVHENL
ncbi:MAG: hypothetical protein ACFB10_00930 [Salibacteraceae bacterium]